MGVHKATSAFFSSLGDRFASTRAEILLDRYAANVRSLLAFIGPEVELIAVVKADGYGHGAAMIGKTALEAGAQHLAVYTPDEAIYLRKSGITGSIVVLGPITPAQADMCVKFEATPCVSKIELAEALAAAAKERGVVVPYHAEVDTGLTRYGTGPQDILALMQAMDELPGLRREGLFTHFASADEASKESVWKQFHIFTKVRKALEENGVTFRRYHAAASAATLEFPEMHLNMVRCGLALYGYYPSPHVNRSVELLPVMTLGSHLARVHAISKGVGVSYGHDWKAKHKSVIGLVPFGYADGMPRNVQGKGSVLVRGQRAPIVGRVAMDQFMVDLTCIKGVEEGDTVTIIGRSGEDEITADEIGEWAGTISYDVLSGVSTRVPRLYTMNGRPISGRVGMTMAVEPV